MLNETNSDNKNLEKVLNMFCPYNTIIKINKKRQYYHIVFS